MGSSVPPACLALLLLVACTTTVLADPEIEYYFYNSATGRTQWEDPGDVPYVDENGNRYWLNESREWVKQDVNAWRYVWVERWSEDHKRPYFFNQETKASTWTRPADLAWQRVMVTDATRAMAPQRTAANAGAGAANAAAVAAAAAAVQASGQAQVAAAS